MKMKKEEEKEDENEKDKKSNYMTIISVVLVQRSNTSVNSFKEEGFINSRNTNLRYISVHRSTMIRPSESSLQSIESISMLYLLRFIAI